MTALAALALAAVVSAVGLSDLRFLRVAQREHYLAGSCSRFAARWWHSSAANCGLVVVSVAGVVCSGVAAGFGLLTAAAICIGPIGLSLRGRTSRLVATGRLVTLAAVLAAFEAIVLAAGAEAGGLGGAVVAGAAVAFLVPLLADAALAVTAPVEARRSRRFVASAASRLERFAPLVVAVTGSYGKTTTKGYIAHLAGGMRAVLPSPHSFNNALGLARTVNEHLGPGVEVLVAEMGTYGRGEIADMCAWLRPAISVITAIGPVHLERFKSLDTTLAAKAEIIEHADVVVLNGDDERLAGLAKDLDSSSKKVVVTSGIDPSAAVAVLGTSGGLELHFSGTRVGCVVVGENDRPSATSNVACAAAAALELGASPEAVLARLASLPVAANRLQRYEAKEGYVVLDDTFNSNPAGSRVALQRLAGETGTGRRVVVTPGMIELGPLQREENAAFAEAAAALGAEIVVVGRTNRAALREGARRAAGGDRLRLVRRIGDAVAVVRAELGAGDAVLYENDLPDHFP